MENVSGDVSGKVRLCFCQLAHGSRTAVIYEPCYTWREVYNQIAEYFHLSPQDIIRCTVNTRSLNQPVISLFFRRMLKQNDIVYAHVKGPRKEVTIIPSAWPIVHNYDIDNTLFESVPDSDLGIKVGDSVEAIDGVNIVGKTKDEVIRVTDGLLNETPYRVTVAESLKPWFCSVKDGMSDSMVEDCGDLKDRTEEMVDEQTKFITFGTITSRILCYCQLAHGSRLGVIYEPCRNILQVYEKIAEYFDLSPSDILFHTVNTVDVNSETITSGRFFKQNDIIYAHVRGRRKEISVMKSRLHRDEHLELLDFIGTGMWLVKRTEKRSEFGFQPEVKIGDLVEEVNDVRVLHTFRGTVHKIMDEAPIGRCVRLTLVEPLKASYPARTKEVTPDPVEYYPTNVVSSIMWKTLKELIMILLFIYFCIYMFMYFFKKPTI